MPCNKPRLYIALYPSGVRNNEELKYHWAFLIGPKVEKGEVVPGTRCHVKNSGVGWTYEEARLRNIRNTTNLLARIVVAKIQDEERLIALLHRVPIIQGDSNWRCLTWIANALAEIAKDGKCVSSAQLDWQKIEAFARQYVGDKTANGRYQPAPELLRAKPTWNMLENKESIP
ncbi:hypothetical protein GQX73_g6014 [Xylaria multiplex]|uniref:Uncharacterized protein n=1 Tax=Xylaria multiplex TaxID=323545 RepID=A0A7C8MSZ5_9PEZI|nr:hypothetical protein GQX73_g6014 [Xylaria multiplex]